MSEQTPTPATDLPPAEPLADVPSAAVVSDQAVSHLASIDNAPTIISKMPPTQAFLPLGTGAASISDFDQGPQAGPLRADRADRRRRHGGGHRGPATRSSTASWP